MKIHRWFLILYSLLVIVLMLLLRFYVQRQLENVAAMTGNQRIETLLEKQVKLTRSPVVRQAAINALAKYRQADFINRITIKKSMMFYNALFVFLFVGMELLFVLGMYVITLPLTRLLKYSSLIAEGRLYAIPTGPKLQKGLGVLGQAFRKLVNDLKKSQERLKAAEKEKTWREIAQVMAHEIKNPLTPLRLSVEMIEERVPELSGQQRQSITESLSTMQEELGRLETLVNRFRDFAKRPELNPSKEDLEALIRETAAPFIETVALTIQNKGIGPRVWIDRVRMRQLFLNLIKNSAEAGARHMTITLRRDDPGFTVKLSDDGQGFSGNMLFWAFVPYTTNKEGGTGLGLSVVKNIVEAHGGTIRVGNNSQGGAEIEFTVHLEENVKS